MSFIFTELPLKDAFVIRGPKFGDPRGYFSETFRDNLFKENVPTYNPFVQDNIAFSQETNILRGLHFQVPPYAQAKLVMVLKGAIIDTIVDIRKDSKTYGEFMQIELNEENAHMLYVPRGFAHGYEVTQPNTLVTYKVDAYYAPDHESGIDFFDEDLGILDPKTKDQYQRSTKDQQWTAFKAFQSPF
jgi:dTDP-4-dehydrorhamnose 3,5-epimerase